MYFLPNKKTLHFCCSILGCQALIEYEKQGFHAISLKHVMFIISFHSPLAILNLKSFGRD